MGGSPAKIVKKVVAPITTIVTPRPGTIGGPPAPAPTPKPTPAPQPVTPTQAEVSQSAATDSEGLSKFQKSRRRGRSATILTSTAGVDESVTLGTKSLLGG